MVRIEAVSFARMKSMNRYLVLTLLRNEGPASRADIARRTGLAPSAVANVVSDLIALGLARESGVAPSAGGRPPTLVAFHERGGFAVGVNIGYTDTVGVVTDLKGKVLVRERLPTGPDRSWEAVRGKVAALVKTLLAASGVDAARVVGVGVGVAGWVDTERGMSVFSPNFGWRQVDVAGELSGLLGLPVWVDNDARLATWGEWRHGAGRGTKDFICVLVGSAVGAGLVLGGRLYYGAHGTAGEIGHTVIDPDGPRCACGKYGCLEAMASGRAIAAAAVAALKRGRSSTLRDAVDGDVERVTGALVGEHAARGDALSIEVLERAGRYLGSALAILVNLANPERIAVGGGVSQAGEIIMRALHESFYRHSVGYAGEKTRIVRAELGKEAGPVGAAELVIDKALSEERIASLLA